MPPRPTQLRRTLPRKVGTSKDHLPACGPIELQDRASGSALAAAAFPDEPEGFTLSDLEGNTVDGLDVTGGPVEE